MEGHAAMDMSIQGGGSVWSRFRSPAGFTAVADVFVMERVAVLRDVIVGLLGEVWAWVPDSFWRHLFLHRPSALGPVVGTSDRASDIGIVLRVLDWHACRWRRCCGTVGSALAAWSHSISPT